MKALLLSAGFGTRLKPITNFVPKCLVKINGRPLIEYWLHSLFSSGIKEILINTHYLSSKVENYINKNRFKSKIHIVREKNLLGTLGTLIKNKHFFKGDDFLVAHADNLCVCNFKDFLLSHALRPSGTLMTMMTFCTNDPENCGIVKVNNNGVMTDFYEKKKDVKGNLANAAIYMMNPKIFKVIKQMNKENSDISKDLIPLLKSKIFTWHNNIYNKDIGKIESYVDAQKEIKNFTSIIQKFKWFNEVRV